MVCGRLGWSSARTKNHRWKSGTCARRSHESDLGSACLGLLPTCSTLCTLAWASPLRPTQTVKRLEKALKTLQSIERLPCDQHDHVSQLCEGVLLSRGVAHALDCNFRLVPPFVMAPLRRRLENGLRQTMSALLDGAVSDLAWERAKRCGGQGIRVAQLGFAAQASYWWAVGLHKAIMPNICGALHRPHLERHPEETFALAAKADLLTVGVAVDDHAMVRFECDARQVRGPRTKKMLRPSTCSGV